MFEDTEFCRATNAAQVCPAPMNPVFIVSLFALSLLAITAACALLLYIANELRMARTNAQKADLAIGTALPDSEERLEKPAEQIETAKTEEVSDFLSKMKASTLIGASRPRKRIDDQDVN